MNWLKLHPKVKAALLGVALVALTDANLAYTGQETWHVAGLAAGESLFVAALAYLRSSGATPPVQPAPAPIVQPAPAPIVQPAPLPVAPATPEVAPTVTQNPVGG